MREDMKRAANIQDEALERAGLSIWIGAEPTFTRRDSQEAPWLTCAEGGDKEDVAKLLLRNLARGLGGGVRIFKLRGRQYPGEAAPRFAYGASWPRESGGVPAPVDDSLLDADPQPVPAPDPAVALLTVTPDPGVVEVNSAPSPNLADFYRQASLIFESAAETGLSPIRYRYSGQIADSGGGGQLSLGGPTGPESPFLKVPWLLPGFLRYFNRHPSLSYLFAAECVGSASQGPRPDEGVRERFEELGVALDFLASRGNAVTPELLWQALAPLLVDAAGNSHRAELNVEKLWNPGFGPRGLMGVVEFRALRMQESPERLVAIAALFRAIAARLVKRPFLLPLVDWGSTLHDRFALPHALHCDLSCVLEDLRDHGFGLDRAFEEILETRAEPIARVKTGEATMTLTPALEFWPLLGDVASQEQAGARLVDASSSRVEIFVTHPRGVSPGRITVGGHEIPLYPLAAVNGGDASSIVAVRFRAFAPDPGLHPGMEIHEPLSVTWEYEKEAIAIDYHQWKPGGGAYPGLPRRAEEAADRRSERVIVKNGNGSRETGRFPAPNCGFTVDLRRLSASGRDV